MKTLVNSLASVVRRWPWWVIGITIAVTMVLGSFASQFVPAEDQNESFAPDAAELTAAEDIGELFGAPFTRMQVLTSSTTGDVITLEGLQAAFALDKSVTESEVSELLVESQGQPAVLSYMAPVQFALQGGAPMPTSDAEVKALYIAGYESLPQEFQKFVGALLSDDGDPTTATSELGLSAISYETSDDFDELALRAKAVSVAVVAAPTPPTITNEPFSVELIFASGEDFQEEILRLFAAAAMIIILVLAIVFAVKPSSVRDRSMFYGGIVLMLLGAAVVVLPSAALVFPDVFPESLADISLGTAMLTALMLYAAAFLLWSFGSPKKLRRTTADTLVTFLTIGFAIQWMSGYGYLRFEDQSQMAQILPILLIGLGVDYSIHMTTRYRQELAGGSPVHTAMGTAIRTVGIALVLATLTTAVGFLTNVTNDLPALAEFGELAAVGIVASFILMLTFVPSIRQLLDRRAEKKDRLETDGLEGGDNRALPRLIGKTAILPKKFAIATIIVSIVFTGAGAYGLSQLSTQFSFLDFVPTTSPLRDTAVTLDDRFDFPETTSVLVEGDVARGSSWNSMLASFTNAAEVEHVQFIETPNGLKIPTGQTFMGVMFQFLNPGSEAFDQELFNIALSVGFTEQRTVPDDADVKPLYDAAYDKYPEIVPSVLARDDGGTYVATLFNFDTTAGEEDAASLKEDLNAAFEPTRVAGLTAVATSTFIINNLVVVSLRDSQVSSLLITMGAALLLLTINFWFESRRPMLGVLTTIPVAMVVLWVFGLMAAFGIPFGPVTATISALGIGIGIPYMIHVTQRYLEERVERSDADEAIEETLVHTGGALAGSALTTMAGFGILMISTTIPFRQFGFVLAYTIFLALIAAVLVLPSMLILWDRWHRNRGDETLDPAVIESALGET
ncbi:MAG: efflux RND transporter permease subunit [Acidimicrobiia bacterium]